MFRFRWELLCWHTGVSKWRAGRNPEAAVGRVVPGLVLRCCTLWWDWWTQLVAAGARVDNCSSNMLNQWDRVCRARRGGGGCAGRLNLICEKWCLSSNLVVFWDLVISQVRDKKKLAQLEVEYNCGAWKFQFASVWQIEGKLIGTSIRTSAKAQLSLLNSLDPDFYLDLHHFRNS